MLPFTDNLAFICFGGWVENCTEEHSAFCGVSLDVAFCWQTQVLSLKCCLTLMLPIGVVVGNTVCGWQRRAWCSTYLGLRAVSPIAPLTQARPAGSHLVHKVTVTRNVRFFSSSAILRADMKACNNSQAGISYHGGRRTERITPFPDWLHMLPISSVRAFHVPLTPH